MRDHETSLSLHQFPHGQLDLLLCLRIHIGSRLVEDQHLGIQQHGSGDGKHLLLSLGETGAVASQNRLISLRHLHDRVMNMRRLAGPHNVIHRRVFFSIRDILVDRSGEQPRILEHHRIRPAQTAPRQPGNVLPVHSDRPGLRVIKPHEKIDQRRLARAGRSDDRRQASRLRMETQVMEDRLTRQISETDVIHPDVPLHIGQFLRALCIRRLRNLVDQAENTLRRRGGRLQFT